MTGLAVMVESTHEHDPDVGMLVRVEWTTDGHAMVDIGGYVWPVPMSYLAPPPVFKPNANALARLVMP